jgi:hypothetical protein
MTSETKLNGIADKVSKDSIDCLLALLPEFESGAFFAADAHYRQTGQYLPQVLRLTDKISESGLALSFDWISWKKSEASRVLTEEGITQADLLTLRKILTYCVEQDRFFGGFLPMVCSNGLILAVLRRLQELRGQA